MIMSHFQYTFFHLSFFFISGLLLHFANITNASQCDYYSLINHMFPCSAQSIVNERRRARLHDRNPTDLHWRVERACRDAKDLRCLANTRPRWTGSYLSARRIASHISRRSRNDEFLLATGFSIYYKVR